MSARYANRRQSLFRQLDEQNLDAFLVTDETNVSYLSGFSGDSSYLLLTRSLALAISDFRYTTQLEEECPDLERAIRGPDKTLSELAAGVIEQSGVRKLGMESSSLPVDSLESISKHVPGVEWVGCPGLIESKLRSVKDDAEVAEIRQALEFAQEGFRQLRTMLNPRMSEFEASYELEHTMRKLGARGHAFPAIIAKDDRAAMPHYFPSRKPIGEPMLLLIDWGAETMSRYRCDLTRTLLFGKPDGKLKDVYETVREAQQLAIAAIKPGASCRGIDALARKYIADKGFGEYFGHGLGHGFGLKIHEQPRFSPLSNDVLEPGMVVTVEPGIYLPGWGGVRIEDNVLVTSVGCEVMSKLPSTLESAYIGLGSRD
jgi:Xaa-Pro aminopeptidase